MKAKIFSALLLAAMLSASFSALAVPSYDTSVNGIVTEWVETFRDDFSQDTGRWTYGGTYIDPAIRVDGHVRLTPATGGRVGYIWFDTEITWDFEVEFDYLIGGGNAADGMVFMFYKDRAYTPGGGGYLGFVGTPTTVQGYGVEMDTYSNGWGNEPGANYLGIIEDNPQTHRAFSYASDIRNNNWHHIKVVVDEQIVKVYYDNMDTVRMTWDATGFLDKSYGGFGFAAGTGGQYDNQLVDNVVIRKQVTYVVIDGEVVSEIEYIQGPESVYEEPQVREDATWTMAALNLTLLAVTILVVTMVAHWIRRKKE
jgi:hypothetical protein